MPLKLRWKIHIMQHDLGEKKIQKGKTHDGIFICDLSQFKVTFRPTLPEPCTILTMVRARANIAR